MRLVFVRRHRPNVISNPPTGRSFSHVPKGGDSEAPRWGKSLLIVSAMGFPIKDQQSTNLQLNEAAPTCASKWGRKRRVSALVRGYERGRSTRVAFSVCVWPSRT